MGNCRLSNKKKGGRDVCKQKITERCVNISKIKKNYLSPTTPFALIADKNGAIFRSAPRKIRLWGLWGIWGL